MSQQPPPDSRQPWNAPEHWNAPQPPNYSQPLHGTPPQPSGYPGQAPLPYQGMPYAPQGQVSPPAKKPKRWPWILAIFVALMIGYGAGSAGHSSTTTPAATTIAPTQAAVVTKPTSVPAAAKPTAVPKPQAPAVLFSQSGNGELTTKSFTAPASWTLSWSCTPDATVGDAPLYINVLQGGQDSFSGDISATCKVGNASGSSQESTSGAVSLHIISGIDWTVKAVAA